MMGSGRQESLPVDDLNNFAKQYFDLTSDAIRRGNLSDALEFIQQAEKGSQANNDGFVSWIESLLTRMAKTNEEEVSAACRDFFYPSTKTFLSNTRQVKDIVLAGITSQIRHHGKFTLKEEPDRYVVTYDPCGSGGRLRRMKPDVGVTKKAYPWSWGKAGVPYYCCHCCVHWELIPAELNGYPTKIVLVGERPEDPCVHLFYKNPELIPEEYFSRIGMKKGIFK